MQNTHPSPVFTRLGRFLKVFRNGLQRGRRTPVRRPTSVTVETKSRGTRVPLPHFLRAARSFSTDVFLITFHCFLLPAFLHAADPVVESVTARQRSGTELVDVEFTVSDADSAELAVWLEAEDTTTNSKIPVGTVHGRHLVPPGTYRLTWDAGKDWNGKVSPAVKVTVVADDSGISPYLLVDLTDYSVVRQGNVSLTDPENKMLKIVFRRIHAGTFLMGSPASDICRGGNETQHQVTLTQDFYMGVFEVTQKQWSLVTNGTPSTFTGDRRPVEYVSWDDIRGGTGPNGDPAATTFMGRLRAETELAFDLPTEAQWEYACRAGTTKAYNSDTDCLIESRDGFQADANLHPLGWYGGPISGFETHEVGLKAANAWGLYDMHGNVREWCRDWYELYSGTFVDPVVVSVYDPVIRGGAWLSVARDCRSAYRTFYVRQNRINSLGFRLALTLAQ